MKLAVQIRHMSEDDINLVYQGLSGHDIQKPLEYIQQCWEENEKGERVTLLAFYENELAGWGHLVFNPHYTYFVEEGIPEIQNLDVIPPLRKRGIGGLLIDALEEQAFAKSDKVGIGFGLYVDYGTAQRLYVKRGYIPDGRGIMYDNVPVEPGCQVRVDDDLVLFLIKSK
ncbi:GNAT family N-acetyltransferase [Paenibacillus sp. NPDC056722]|uniref:GNAT family N-acetyltransferase n=1 Tax=Paenibacillus sp. NPDC056722 TaxID=3345924 RepID=UPI003674A43C